MRTAMSQKPKLPNIIFFGNESIATGVSTDTPVLKGLVKSGYHVSLVVVNKHQVSSRCKGELEIIQAAQALNIPTASPARLADIADQIKSIQPAIGILVAYGRIIPADILDLFPHGIINIHPSLLPEYRGPTPIEQAILDGKSQTGVTVMRVTPQMDAGPILGQAKVTLRPSSSKQALADQLLAEGYEMVFDLLPKILSHSAIEQEQNDDQPTYTKLITKADGKLNGTKSQVQLAREVKAYAGWPSSYLEYKGKSITVLDATASTVALPPGQLARVGKKLFFGCKGGSLEIIKLRPAGKSAMATSEFINGQPDLSMIKVD